MDEKSQADLPNLTEKIVSPIPSPVLSEPVISLPVELKDTILDTIIDPGVSSVLPESAFHIEISDPNSSEEIYRRYAGVVKTEIDKLFMPTENWFKSPPPEKLFIEFDKFKDFGLGLANDKKVADLAEKTHLPQEEVRDYMNVRLAAASQIQAERERRYPIFVLRALKKVNPDKFDLEKIIEDERAIDQFLNEEGLNSFHAPEGDENDWHVGLWRDMVGSGQEIASHQPGFFMRTIDAYREKGSLNVKHDAPSEQSIWTDVLSASQIKQMGREMLAGAKNRLTHASLPDRMSVIEVADFPEAVRVISSARKIVARHTADNIADLTERKRKMAIFSSILANRLYPNSKIEQQEQTLKKAMEIEPLLTGATEGVKFNDSQTQNVVEIMGLQMDDDRRNAKFWQEGNNPGFSQWAEFYTRAADRIENALKLLLHSSIEE